ncbi:MAG TPA: hypothetical protein VHE12_07560 [bacterium]|nr:hypothetical protein [bacterium]
MRRLFLLGSLLLFPLSAPCDEPPQRFSLDLDLLGHLILPPGAGGSFGPGASVFAEWRPAPVLSFGTGLGFSQMFDGPSASLVSWDLGGRLYPLGTTREGEWYLQGTAGLALEPGLVDGMKPGSFHGTAVVGYRVFMSDRQALDLGAQYELLSPFRHPFQGMGLRIGWSFLFGPTPRPASRDDTPDGTLRR